MAIWSRKQTDTFTAVFVLSGLGMCALAVFYIVLVITGVGA